MICCNDDDGGDDDDAYDDGVYHGHDDDGDDVYHSLDHIHHGSDDDDADVYVDDFYGDDAPKFPIYTKMFSILKKKMLFTCIL